MSNALMVLSAGLPVSAKSILEQAMSIAFGDSVEVQELTKENLRSRVRLSLRNTSIVLVILDRVSSDICKDIENGLYSSDKYYTYVSDKELVSFLNNKYSIDLVIEEDVEDIPISESDDSSCVVDNKYYLDQLKVKDDIIHNLEVRIHDLFDFYDGGSGSGISEEELDALKDENIRLNNEVLDLKSNIDDLKGKLSESELRGTSLSQECDSLNKKITSLNIELKNNLKDLEDLRISHTKQSGVLRDKDYKIQELTKSLDKCNKDSEKIKDLEKNILDLKESLLSKESEAVELRVDLQSKEREVNRYRAELDSLKSLGDVNAKLEAANATINSLNSELSIIGSERDTIKKENKDKDRTISQLSERNEILEKDLQDAKSEVESLNIRVQEDDTTMLQLNKENLKLQNKLGMFEKVSKSNDEVDSLLKDISELQDKISVLSNNIFNRIGQSALPNGSLNVSVLSGKGKLKNVTFAFSGNAESRKGTYKCLLNDLKYSNQEDRYLIVDLVSETSIDYVFEISRVIPGLEWFRKGGSVQKYVSSTVLKNVSVLSAGLGFINDSYFLCIDWAKRLSELNNSGYKVIVYCGDISNLVGRILHESFVNFGDSSIYVHGNAVGCRTIVTNLRGLGNAKLSKVLYYDYNQSFQKFFNMVSKTNECKVISSKGSTR